MNAPARPSLLLSDLHLPAAPSPLRERFGEFLAGPARQADTLYLLGDIFEYWIGDDAGLRDYAPEINALRDLVGSGVRVCFMAGNRDFLVGQAFFDATGVQPLADPTVLEIGGVATLLSHGDAYCTDDQAYQRWRRWSRRPLVQQLYARLPLRWRRRIASGLRQHSRQTQTHKAATITDVNAEAIANAFADSGAVRMIHGHTHRPARHVLRAADRARERIVLADWRLRRCEYLEVDELGCRRRRHSASGWTLD